MVYTSMLSSRKRNIEKWGSVGVREVGKVLTPLESFIFLLCGLCASVRNSGHKERKDLRESIFYRIQYPLCSTKGRLCLFVVTAILQLREPQVRYTRTQNRCTVTQEEGSGKVWG